MVKESSLFTNRNTLSSDFEFRCASAKVWRAEIAGIHWTYIAKRALLANQTDSRFWARDESTSKENPVDVFYFHLVKTSSPGKVSAEIAVHHE